MNTEPLLIFNGFGHTKYTFLRSVQGDLFFMKNCIFLLSINIIPFIFMFFGSTPELVETRFSERSRNSKFQLSGNQVDHGSEPFVGVEASGLSLGRLNHRVYSFADSVG